MSNEKVKKVSDLSTLGRLVGDIAEIIFEHFCCNNEYAYIKPEKIYTTLTPKNILTFKYGFKRIPVKIPKELISEIWHVCRPSNNQDGSPSYTVDYLTLSLNCVKENDYKEIQSKYYAPSKPLLIPEWGLTWVEVKSKNGEMSEKQELFFSEKGLIKKSLFKVPIDKDILPEKLKIQNLKHIYKKNMFEV